MISKINNWLAEHITQIVGTMWCAYLFTIIGALGIYGALGNKAHIVLIVGAISGYFLQLVLLPVIIVGQNIQSEKQDQHTEQLNKIHKTLKKQS